MNEPPFEPINRHLTDEEKRRLMDRVPDIVILPKDIEPKVMYLVDRKFDPDKFPEGAAKLENIE